MRTQTLILLAMFVAAPAAVAVPTLSPLFSDHMVLQQGKPIPLWGTADPGESIRITLAGQSVQVTARGDGRWRTVLEPLAPGGPFTMVVEGRKRIQVRDVLVGEVWVASGQSNMHFALGGADTAAKDLPAAGNGNLRLFTVPRTSALKPLDRAAAQWVPCTPESAAGFSAVAYYFGAELQRKLGVPVGLIHTSWPGSVAEEWVDPATLSTEAEFAPIFDRWRRAEGATFGPEEKPADFDLLIDDVRLIPAPGETAEPVLLGDFGKGMPRNAMGGEWSFSWDSAPLALMELADRGDPAAPGQVLRVAGRSRYCDSAMLRVGFLPAGVPADLHRYSGIRFRVRGRGFLKVHLLQPTITDWDNYATGVVAAGTEWTEVTVSFRDLEQAGWGVRQPFTPQALSGMLIEILTGPDGTRAPSGLFNGMIAPLLPYGLRGVIWYQGEGNSGRAYQYRKLLPALIRSWRAAWQQDDFPFLVVQLPNYGQRQADPSESEWAELREAQLRTLGVPGTGLAVTIDLGEANNVHPKNKKPVGLRLARWALTEVYGGEGARSGPLFEGAAVEGAAIHVRFSDVGGGLVAMDGKPLRGFALAGADKKFYWADARIEGKTVVVSSSRVPTPVAVRYAWAANPDCNLGNKEGLPASPFRSDDWPGRTVYAR